MNILRDRYIKKILDRKNNGLIKIITGIRRCGKSYLLFKLYHDELIRSGIKPSHIIGLALDDIKFAKYRDPLTLYQYIKSKIKGKGLYYIFLDEIQLLHGDLADLLNGLLHIPNLDIYITGSNSRFLSTDIVTELRGRGDEVRVFPLSFQEFSSVYANRQEAWKDYYTYGGLPLIVARKRDELKAEYLISLLQNIYIKDIKDRYTINVDSDLDTLLDVVASCSGSLINPAKLSRSFASITGSKLSDKTIKLYLSYLTDAFLLERSLRYDIKGKKYINTPVKYYFVDVGLRNARLNFRQQEESHIMENILYLELRSRGFRVDVGTVAIYEQDKKEVRRKKQLEIDFIANKGDRKYYIQSVLQLSSAQKMEQEKRPLVKVNDSFKKIVVVKDDIKPKVDDAGVMTISLFDFLLDENILESI